MKNLEIQRSAVAILAAFIDAQHVTRSEDVASLIPVAVDLAIEVNAEFERRGHVIEDPLDKLESVIKTVGSVLGGDITPQLQSIIAESEKPRKGAAKKKEADEPTIKV